MIYKKTIVYKNGKKINELNTKMTVSNYQKDLISRMLSGTASVKVHKGSHDDTSQGRVCGMTERYKNSSGNYRYETTYTYSKPRKKTTKR